MVTRTDSKQGAQHRAEVAAYEQPSLPCWLDAVFASQTSITEPLRLERLGRLAVRAWCAGRQLASGLLTPPDLLRAAAVADDAALDEEIAIVASHLSALGSLTEQSQERMLAEIGRFVRRIEIVGVHSLSAVSSIHAADFINEATVQRDRLVAPATGTLHLRRSAVRLLFRAARQLHLVEHDPTLDLVLPRRSDLQTRPLTDDEELLGRLASRDTLTATRLRAAWALGQATAVSSELATVTGLDVDLGSSRVWLHGSGNRAHRWGRLSEWGIQQVADRMEALGDPSQPLVYGSRKSAKSGQTSSCEAVRVVLRHAGLHREADVRPGSLAAWAGRREYDATKRIEAVAALLGLRSLDRAARVIGWNWQ